MILEILKTIFMFVGVTALVLTIRAIMLGPTYLMAINFGWSKRTLHSVFEGNILGLLIFRATVIGVLLTGIVAAISTLYALLWPLDGMGYINPDGEWTSYRIAFSSTIGFPLGFGFVGWIFKTCKRVPLPQEVEEEMHPPSQLRLILGKPLSG